MPVVWGRGWDESDAAFREPTAGGGEVRSPQPSWQGAAPRKGAPSQRPCRTLDSAAVRVQQDSPLSETLRVPSVPLGLCGLSASPTLTGRSCRHVCRQRAASSRAAVQDSNPAPVAGLRVHSTSPTAGPMGPASSQHPSHTQAPTRGLMGTICGNVDAREKHSCQGQAGLASTTCLCVAGAHCPPPRLQTVTAHHSPSFLIRVAQAEPSWDRLASCSQPAGGVSVPGPPGSAFPDPQADPELDSS